ncbi:VCBS repeat-containing protein [Clostridium tetani]|nr:VCBS repeat-containing protein [Clostridium tetani]
MYNYYFRNYIVHTRIVAYAKGDVNGDRITDNVYLTAMKASSSPFVENATLVIQDGRTGRFTNIQLNQNSGYSSRLFLGDFTGDGVNEILISIDSGDSSATTYDYIYSFVNNVPRLLFDFEEYNDEYKYNVNFKDNHKVEFISEKNDQRYIINISSREIDYLNKVYNKNEKLKKITKGFVNPLSGLYTVDFDSDGICEVLAYQKILGRSSVDTLGYVLNTLKWKKDKFYLANQNVSIFGVENK